MEPEGSQEPSTGPCPERNEHENQDWNTIF
jgi:hypothetical protein